MYRSIHSVCFGIHKVKISLLSVITKAKKYTIIISNPIFQLQNINNPVKNVLIGGCMAQIRNKHYKPEFKKLRGQKVIKIIIVIYK